MAVSDNNVVNETETSDLEEDIKPGEGEIEAAAEVEIEEVPDLETQLKEAEAQAAEYLDGWQRARAELANYKKRAERERGQLVSMIKADVILDLVPILDDLELAVENLPQDLDGHEWASGVLLIQRKLVALLEEMGLEEIEAVGQPFDPELHEAVMQMPSDEHEPGIVVDVLRKGYRMDDRIIRAAMVRVAE
jgi:molecular chaperone GrpE